MTDLVDVRDTVEDALLRLRPEALLFGHIARVAGVSLVWLATGEGAPSGDAASTPGPSSPVDEALLETVIESVEAGLQQIGGQLSADKKAKLVTAIYRIYQSGGEARKAPVLELVRLAV